LSGDKIGRQLKPSSVFGRKMVVFETVAFSLMFSFFLLWVRLFWLMIPLLGLKEDLFKKLKKHHPEIFMAIIGRPGESVIPRFGAGEMKYEPYMSFINGPEEGLNDEVRVIKGLIANRIDECYKNFRFMCYALGATLGWGMLIPLMLFFGWLK
jgi:hypothetical protein